MSNEMEIYTTEEIPNTARLSSYEDNQVKRDREKYIKVVDNPEKDKEYRVASVIMLKTQKQGSKGDIPLYCIPLVKGWSDLLAEWYGDIKLVTSNAELHLVIGTVDPTYLGKVYWGSHIEVGTDNTLKNEIIEKYGIPLNLLRVEKIPNLNDETYMFEMIIPPQALATTEHALPRYYKALDRAFKRRAKI